MATELTPEPNLDYGRELMATMIATSQVPGGGNQEFVSAVREAVPSYLTSRVIADPEYPDRSLLVFEVGDPEGEQVLAAVSHSDVVGIDGQNWESDPFQLTETDGTWYGRGTCDTHGSGVSMLLAASQASVRERLEQNNARVSIIFTYDEEATSPELSMRGARLAAGLLGEDPVVTGNYYIAGEPTEFDGHIIPMRAHKGRWLAQFAVTVEHCGHVSENVQNALMTGASIVHDIAEYSSMLRLGSAEDEEAQIYSPPHSTVQVSAADVKSTDFSTTPETAKFTVDMRTLPDIHRLRVREMTDLITRRKGLWLPGTAVELEVLKDADGSTTPVDSAIAQLAERITGFEPRGFNGGDEGRIFRLLAGKQGLTLGPGELSYAHMPNEQVTTTSIVRAAAMYAQLFSAAVELER